MNRCEMCPRRCGVGREDGERGYCGAPFEFLVSRAALHLWEEPPISGKNGSGAIFFGGCNLRCVYCQNRAINDGTRGEIFDGDRLFDAIERLVSEGAHNINFVTPTHYLLPLASFLEKKKPRIPVPVVWNCGGYEDADLLRRLDGLVDIYLPDFKYASRELAAKYSHAPDYPEVASAAICEMFRQRGEVRFGEDGMLRSGVVVRHLVLPGCRADSVRVLETLSGMLPVPEIRLSLMSQFTPDFVDRAKYPELGRRVTSFEYGKVLDRAVELGFEGYFQNRSSATKAFTPDF